MQSFDALCRESGRDLERIHASAEKRFRRIDITQSEYLGLIQEQGLESALRSREVKAGEGGRSARG